MTSDEELFHPHREAFIKQTLIQIHAVLDDRIGIIDAFLKKHIRHKTAVDIGLAFVRFQDNGGTGGQEFLHILFCVLAFRGGQLRAVDPAQAQPVAPAKCRR